MRKAFIFIVALAVLAGGAWGARKGYRYWKQEHLIQQARYFLSQSDPANAMLCLQQAVQSNPNNVAACRMFADFAEASHSRNAIFWRRRVAELEPKSAQDRFDWAKTALKLGDAASADLALSSVAESARQTAEYHKNVAALAWAVKQYSLAETNFQEVVRLEPTNIISRLNLAIVQLATTNDAKAGQGRMTLVQLTTNAAVRSQALRQLTFDAVRHGKMEPALSYSRDLQKEAEATFADQLLRLDVLSQAKSPLLAAELSALERESASNRFKAYDLGGWLCGQGRTNDAIAWIHTLPAAVQTDLPLPLLTANGLAALGRWSDLESLIAGQNWKDREYLRHAFQARALKSKGNAMGASVEWRNALKAGTAHLEALNDLVRRTAGWGWETEMKETLWTIVDHFPLDKEAFLVLYEELFTAGDTPGLHKLLAKTSAAVPANAEIENNLAIVSLLLNSQENKAHDMALEVYGKDPKNPYFLSTYAYSLYLRHKSDEALKLFDGLPAQQLTNPGVAAYYGIILSGAGKGAKARPYLELAGGARLLPEEKDLIRKAKQGS